MNKVSLAMEASKLPIFKMFLLARKEWANVTPLKNGDCRVSFWDDSSFVLLKDGSIVFEYVVNHIKYNHLTPLFFSGVTFANSLRANKNILKIGSFDASIAKETLFIFYILCCYKND
jgi:hypothetical protein